jgi:hypothetical protein
MHTCWRSLTHIFNCQSLHKIHTNKHQNLENRDYTNNFHKFWCLHILQDIYMDTIEIIVKRHNSWRRKHQSAQKNERKAYSTEELGPTTDGGATQAQPLAHLPKAVARRASHGAAAPWVCPHPRRRGSGPSSSGGCMPPWYGRFARLPCRTPQTDHEHV